VLVNRSRNRNEYTNGALRILTLTLLVIVVAISLAVIMVGMPAIEAEAVMDHDGRSGCDKRVPGEIGECSDGGREYGGDDVSLP
jgi:hypothetical protein